MMGRRPLAIRSPMALDILQGCFVIEGWDASTVPACGDSGSYFDATSSCTLTELRSKGPLQGWVRRVQGKHRR